MQNLISALKQPTELFVVYNVNENIKTLTLQNIFAFYFALYMLPSLRFIECL